MYLSNKVRVKGMLNRHMNFEQSLNQLQDESFSVLRVNSRLSNETVSSEPLLCYVV